MTNTGKSKMLVSLVLLLLLTNAIVIYFLLQSKNELKKTPEQKQVEYMRKELGLSDEQTQKYKALRVYRDSLLSPMYDSLREVKMDMVNLLRQPSASVSDSTVEKFASEISRRQQRIEIEYYQHFRRVQAICKPDQLPLFDSVLVSMVNRTTRKSK